MRVSVIIPTYNRLESVKRALSSLRRQTLPAGQFEVVVVDDGSEYEPTAVVTGTYPFALKFIRQENQGATVARNHGVRQSRGEVLVFMDDDVTVSPPALAALAEALAGPEKWLALGTLIAREVEDTPFARDAAAEANAEIDPAAGDTFVDFVWCNTQLLGVRRKDYEALGGLQDPTGGWPNWDDVDFGYRANQAGFQLRRVADAVGEHWDYSLSYLDKASQRWRRAGLSATKLFTRYPNLPPHLPMFADKLPIDWQRDGLLLIGRKLARLVLSASWMLWGMEWATAVLERIMPGSVWLSRLYRWIQGGYLARGYREGLDGV